MPFLISLAIGVAMLLTRTVFHFQREYPLFEFDTQWVAFDIAAMILAVTGFIGVVVASIIVVKRVRQKAS